MNQQIQNPQIFVAGDSLAVTRSVTHLPLAGWGQVLNLFLTDRVSVVNCARARASSKSFADRGRLRWILDHARPGDYVLISFGRIDMRLTPGMHTEPFGSYQEYLRSYVDGVRERRAHPVLVSPYENRWYDTHGNNKHSLGPYPMAMAEVAAERSVPFVDLYGQSLAWWQELGQRRTKDLFAHLTQEERLRTVVDPVDNTHLRVAGSVECARFVARALREQGVVPSDWVVDLHRDRFDTAELGWVGAAEHAETVRARVAAPGPDAP